MPKEIRYKLLAETARETQVMGGYAGSTYCLESEVPWTESPEQLP